MLLLIVMNISLHSAQSSDPFPSIVPIKLMKLVLLGIISSLANAWRMLHGIQICVTEIA